MSREPVVATVQSIALRKITDLDPAPVSPRRSAKAAGGLSLPGLSQPAALGRIREQYRCRGASDQRAFKGRRTLEASASRRTINPMVKGRIG